MASVRSNALFKGKVYAKGKPMTCSTDISNSVEFSLPISLNGPDCGTVSENQLSKNAQECCSNIIEYRRMDTRSNKKKNNFQSRRYLSEFYWKVIREAGRYSLLNNGLDARFTINKILPDWNPGSFQGL
ncbi:hypothetical protein AVEN_60038-1 [Araneus ventricosus]|uniref:Uncharacterized protein n=1 Tax=Araneus ventricosus TaxID=182803 RepID=A0A4Y2CBH5_ARAVE|nr:hypothetical protein AVEN_60038-1 [Araneus ventricosus]